MHYAPQSRHGVQPLKPTYRGLPRGPRRGLALPLPIRDRHGGSRVNGGCWIGRTLRHSPPRTAPNSHLNLARVAAGTPAFLRIESKGRKRRTRHPAPSRVDDVGTAAVLRTCRPTTCKRRSPPRLRGATRSQMTGHNRPKTTAKRSNGGRKNSEPGISGQSRVRSIIEGPI